MPPIGDGLGLPLRRRGFGVIGVLTLLLAGAFATLATPASAQLAHPSVANEFGPDGTSATTFGTTNTLAYQQASHRIYVEAQSSIFAFSNPSAGTFTPLGGNFPLSIPSDSTDSDIGVDNSPEPTANNIYYSRDGTEMRGYDSTGTVLPGWPASSGGEVCGVAVDNDGNIWGGEYGNGGNAVKWEPAGGSPVQTISTSATAGTICKIAVDQSNNDVYVSQYGGSAVYRYSAASGYSAATPFSPVFGTNNRLAVDGAAHLLFVGGPSSNSRIQVFDTVTGELQDTIELASGQIKGLAVDESNDTLFVAIDGSKVMELPAVELARATTGAPTANDEVSGMADPDGAGDITECFFEFGTSTSYGSREDCTESTPISSSEAVHAVLPGLARELTYHYRLVLKNGNGEAKGADETFVPHNVVDLNADPPSEPSPGRVTLNGSFTGDGSDTHFYFEYVDASGYEPSAEDPYAAGATTPAPPGADAGSGGGPQQVSAVAIGLDSYTTYHFRVVATNGRGTTKSPDRTFFSPPPDLPAVDATYASDVTQGGATLNAQVNPGFGATIVRFQYGATSEYDLRTLPSEPIGSDGSDHLVSSPVARLEPGRTYHYRVLATNFSGTTAGPDQTLTTAAAVSAPPVVVPVISAVAPPRAAVRPSPRASRCGALSLRAKHLGKKAHLLRRKAAHANGGRHALALRRRAAKLSAKAKRLSREAHRCRRPAGGRNR